MNYVAGADPVFKFFKSADAEEAEEELDVSEMKTDEIIEELKKRGFEKTIEIPPPPPNEEL